MLDLTSGYVRRGVDRLPKQGSASPWRVTQSYFADYRLLQRQALDDEVMEFSNPASTVGAAAALADV
jgi:monooxygenase